MRFTTIIGAFMASSVLALPACTLFIPWRAPALTGPVQPLSKRQLPLPSITNLTSSVTDVTSLLNPILSNVITTVSNLDGSIATVSTDTEADIDGTLTTVQSEVTGLINKLNSVVDVADVTGTVSGLGGELNNAITKVQTLLTDIEAAPGTVDTQASLAEVEGLVNQLLGLLTRLLGGAKV